MRGFCVLSGVSIRRWWTAVPVRNVFHKCAGVVWWLLCVRVSAESLGMRACLMSVILGYWVKAFFRLICFKRDRMCLTQCSCLCGLDCMWVCYIWCSENIWGVAGLCFLVFTSVCLLVWNFVVRNVVFLINLLFMWRLFLKRILVELRIRWIFLHCFGFHDWYSMYMCLRKVCIIFVIKK